MTWRADDWRSESACLAADPDLFFPVSATAASAPQVARAKAVCARCPVCTQCLNFALDNPDMQGIWGGHTDDERRKVRRSRARSLRRRGAAA
jgi:WhiB family transcriptional regulator, redox-sensing transcriptional regulator